WRWSPRSLWQGDGCVRAKRRCDTEGSLLAALVQTANVQDNHGAVPLLRSIGRRFPRDEWIDQTLAWLAGAIDRWLQPAGDALANGVAIETELASNRRDPLWVKIENHDDFPKLDHRILDRAGLGDRFAAHPRARPGDRRHDQLGIFKPHFWGELLRHQHSASGRRSKKCSRRRAASVAGCTRPPMSSISCRRASNRKPSGLSRRSGWPRPRRMRSWPSTPSSKAGASNTTRRSSV